MHASRLLCPAPIGDDSIYTLNNLGCRAAGEVKQAVVHHQYSYIKPQPLQEDPVPFNLLQHGHRYIRCSHDQCPVHYVLFMLDTSRSIGEENFCKMTCELGNLVQWFCDPIQIAAMTLVMITMKKFASTGLTIPVRNGIVLKELYKQFAIVTVELTQLKLCSVFFDNMLTEECGLPVDVADKCISVVFFTDGGSNDPGDICSVITELKGCHNFESFSIGIGDIRNETELRCIANLSNVGNCQFPTFDRFVRELNTIETVFDDPVTVAVFDCVNHPTTINPLEWMGVLQRGIHVKI